MIRAMIFDLDGILVQTEKLKARSYAKGAIDQCAHELTEIELDVPVPVITLSLLMRLVSRQEDSCAAKILVVTRQQFGGHALKP